jgi:hypothetical protein
MGDMEIPDELIDQLLGEYQGPEQLTGPDGLIKVGYSLCCPSCRIALARAPSSARCRLPGELA